METIDRRSYGGKIYDSDFDVEYRSLSYIASRIAGDMRFDERCRRAVEQRDRMKSGFYRENKNSKSE